MGDAVNISSAGLPSQKAGWVDGSHWLNEVREWSFQYEIEHMVPAKANGQLVTRSRCCFPEYTKEKLDHFGKHLVSVLLTSVFINAALMLRKWFLCYFVPPRPELLRKKYFSDEPDKSTGRYSAKEYLSHPW